MLNYTLVNPYIEGDFKKSYSASSPIDAAQSTWKNLSQYITGDVPKFAFTLQKEGSNELLHFLVKEEVNNKTADYTLERISKKIPKKVSDKFLSSLKTRKNQLGGRRGYYDDDDDNEDIYDSDIDIYRRIRNKMTRLTSPIVYWNYVPWLYEIDYVYMPTFIKPLSPYVYIDLSPYSHFSSYFN